MICVPPLEKKTKRWKNLVAARGEDMALILWTAYDGNIPESEYNISKQQTPSITPNDKIIWGHPTIGKSYLKQQGDNSFITLDDDYADEVNAFIDANRGSETRQEYKGRKPIEYNEFMLNLFDRLKVQAEKEGKKLFVSNTNILKERMFEFDKVVNIPKNEFKKRFDARGATYGFEDWKSDIDNTISKVDTNKVINTTGYLSDLFTTSDSNILSDARFKLENKPVYTLEENPERKQRFIEDLKIGNNIAFEYWSNISLERAKRRNIMLTGYNLAEGWFSGYEDGLEKKFLINNIIDRTNPLANALNEEEVNEFKKSLNVGKAVSFFDNLTGNVAERTLFIESIEDDMFTGTDVDTDEEISIPYSSIVKRDTVENELKVSDYVKKIRNVISAQLKYLKPRIKDANDQALYNSIIEAQEKLSDYKGVQELESLIAFLKEIDISIKKTKVLIDNIETQGGDVPSQLRRIGLLKDFIDGHKDIEKILNPIKESNPNSEMNEVINNIIANIHSAEVYYFKNARPKIAKWLYDHMSPELNENLKKHGMEIITLSSLEEFLSNPKNDLTWMDTFLVASSNVNDSVTGLFSLALKRIYNLARRMNVMYKENLLPLFDVFSKRGYNAMIESYRKMFFYEVIHTEAGPIAKRRWVTEYNDYQYYAKLNEFKRKLLDISKASFSAKTLQEADAYRSQAESLKQERDAYIKRCNIKLTFPEVKEMMDKLKIDDNIKFRDLLNNKYNFSLSPVTEKNVKENGLKEPANSLLIDGRYYVYKGGMQILNKELFKNKQYDTLKADPDTFKLYEYIKQVYDECEKKLPIKQRLGGYVPAQGITSIKEDTKQFMSLEESTKYSSNLVKLDGDVYKEIPLYFEKPQAKVLTDDKTINILDGNSSLIDDSLINNNMIKAVLNYASQANMYKALDSSIGAITSTLDVVKEAKPKNPDGSNIGTNRRYDKFVNLANQLVYGEKKENPTFWTRLVDVLGKITQFVNLGFSPAVYINNFIMGNMANLSEAQGGRNFNKKELAWANKEFFKLIPDFIKDKHNSKLYKIITRYDAIQGEFNTELGKGFGSKWENLKEESFYAFTGSNLGELEIQGTTLLALMKARGLWDKFDDNGNPITELDLREEETFMNVLHELNKSNHGVYNDFDRLYLQPNAIFRLMLQYRKYVVPTYRAKWYGLFGARDQAKRIDMEAGTVEQGYYASFRFFLEDNWRNALKLPTLVENYNNLTDYEKEGVRRSLLDVIYIFAGMVLLNALLPDEDDEDAGFIAQWAALSVRKSVSEVSAYIPLFGTQDQLRTVSTPFVAAKTVNNFLKVISQTCGYDFEDGEWKMFEQYDRKYGMYEKGDYKLEAAVNKVAPIHNVVEAYYPGILLDNFEKANRRG
jgi:hypothetical protein